MPNWCDNSLELHHDDKSKIDALEAELQKWNDNSFKDGARLFNALRPQPEDIGDNWYNWNIENWGSKWDADIIDWDRSGDNEIHIYFNSAWSPPIALYHYLDEHGWTVEALYHECGMCYAGQFKDHFDDYYEYDIADQSSIDELPADVVEFAGIEYAHEEWMSEQINDYLVDLDRTEWFPKKVKPAYVGRYEVTSKAWAFPQYCEWNGENWQRWAGDEIQVTQWRGLQEEFTDVKYQEMLDNIAENN